MKNKEYYNKIYSKSEKYKAGYKDIIYYPVYKKILQYLNYSDQILELGCGSGHLAHLLKDKGFNNYTGLDFSDIAIDHARLRTSQLFIWMI